MINVAGRDWNHEEHQVKCMETGIVRIAMEVISECTADSDNLEER